MPEHYGSIQPALKRIAANYIKGLETLIRLLGSVIIIGILSIMASALSLIIIAFPLQIIGDFEKPESFSAIPFANGFGPLIAYTTLFILAPLIIRFGLSATGFSHPTKFSNRPE